jgi:hypothetical protein
MYFTRFEPKGRLLILMHVKIYNCLPKVEPLGS